MFIITGKGWCLLVVFIDHQAEGNDHNKNPHTTTKSKYGYWVRKNRSSIAPPMHDFTRKCFSIYLANKSKITLEFLFRKVDNTCILISVDNLWVNR